MSLPDLLSSCQIGSTGPSNYTEKVQCCVDSCTKYIVDCNELCSTFQNNSSDYKKCREKCNNLSKDCMDPCIDYTSHNMLGTCIHQNNCGVFPNFDKDCINNNRKNIISCCQKACDDAGNCSLSCEDAFINLLNIKNPLPEISKYYDITSLENPMDPNQKIDIYRIILIVIISLMIIATVYLYFIK